MSFRVSVPDQRTPALPCLPSYPLPSPLPLLLMGGGSVVKGEQIDVSPTLLSPLPQVHLGEVQDEEGEKQMVVVKTLRLEASHSVR